MAKNRKRKNRCAQSAIRLEDELGNLMRLLTSEQLDHMLSRHAHIQRVSKTVYRMIPEVQPSTSREDMAQLTRHDMDAYAFRNWEDGALSTRQRERLIGHRLIAAPKSVTKSERSILRAIYTAVPQAVSV